MNTIRNYLENLFLGLPHTEDVNRAKNELLAMMEDKYNELKEIGKTENEAIGIVISEFGNLDELSETLGIKQIIENKTETFRISYEEAQAYIEDSRAIAPKTATGVFLCIMSPVILMLLLGLGELGYISIKEDLLIAAGLVVIISLVAFGVLHFIKFSGKLEKYDELKSELFEIDYKTEQMVLSVKQQDEESYKSAVSISIVCYILSALPILTIPLIFEADGLGTISVALTLTIVAFSTYNIISKSSVHEACNVLLQREDYSVKKKSNKTHQVVSSVYWSVIVAVYLGYSFITHNWAISWVIWPVAGVLYSGINAITNIR